MARAVGGECGGFAGGGDPAGVQPAEQRLQVLSVTVGGALA
jgi:hypothetical protein